MSLYKKLCLVLASVLIVSFLSGCEDRSAERAGEKIDEATEEAGDKIEDATDR
jgi:hypothetical protein